MDLASDSEGPWIGQSPFRYCPRCGAEAQGPGLSCGVCGMSLAKSGPPTIGAAQVGAGGRLNDGPPPHWWGLHRDDRRVGRVWALGSVVTLVFVAAGVVLGIPQIRHRTPVVESWFATNAAAAHRGSTTTIAATTRTASADPVAQWQSICTGQLGHRSSWTTTEAGYKTNRTTVCGYTLSDEDPVGDGASAGQYYLNLVVYVTARGRGASLETSDDSIVVAPGDDRCSSPSDPHCVPLNPIFYDFDPSGHLTADFNAVGESSRPQTFVISTLVSAAVAEDSPHLVGNSAGDGQPFSVSLGAGRQRLAL